MSNRAAYALAFACWGAAIGVVIYRVAILGLAGAGDGYGFPATVGVLAVLGRFATRDHDRPAIAPLLVAGVAGLGLGFAASYVVVPPLGSSRLATHQFPGFSVDLPSGDIRSEDHGYPTGKMTVRLDGATAMAEVQWEPGGDITDDELKIIASGIAEAAGGTGPGSVTSLAGVPTIAVSTDKGLFEISMEQCGARHVGIATSGGDGIAELHRRIVATFQCHPDAAKEAGATALAFPLILDVPGWHMVASAPNQIQITDDNSVLYLQQGAPQSARDFSEDLASLISSLAKSQGLGMTVGTATNGRAPMTIKNGDDTATGFVQVVTCPTAVAFVIAIVPDAKQTAAVEAIIDHARCLKPGEAAQKFPNAAPPP